MSTIEERVAALERALASMDRAWAMMEKRTSDMICAAIEDRCGDAARRRDDRLAALEREDSARKGLEHEHGERIHTVEAAIHTLNDQLAALRLKTAPELIRRAPESVADTIDPIPDFDQFQTYVGNESNPNAAGIAVLRADRRVHMLGGQDERGLRLSQIESELSALAARRGTLVGERERLRGAP